MAKCTVFLDRRLLEADALPPFCMRCGEPAAVRIKRVYPLSPPEADEYLQELIDWFISLLRDRGLGWEKRWRRLKACFRDRRLHLQAPMCSGHRRHWFWRKLVMLGGFAMALGGMLFLAWAFQALFTTEAQRGWLGLSYLIFVVTWFCVSVYAHESSIHPVHVGNSGITLKGVGPNFFAALEGKARDVPEAPSEPLPPRRWRSPRDRPDRSK